MTKKCCAKQNIITYEDGSGLCQSCGTAFEGGEAVAAVAGVDPNVVAEMAVRISGLEGETSELRRQIEEVKGVVASHEQRVLGLEGRVVTPS